jgi:hypothetical protein
VADRRNLSIPMNLAFLAGLLAASHLATATAPTQPQSATAEITAANSPSSPPPTVEPVDDRSDGGLVMTLSNRGDASSARRRLAGYASRRRTRAKSPSDTDASSGDGGKAGCVPPDADDTAAS